MLHPLIDDLRGVQARFHAWAQHELCEQPAGLSSNLALPFDSFQNLQQLNKILDMLSAMSQIRQFR